MGLERPSARALTASCGDRSRRPAAPEPQPGEITMALERSDVEKIAHLARLGLNDADLPQTTATLNSILGLIDAMQAVDTEGVEPLAHPLEATQRLRADVVSETNQREAYQAIAPAVENGLYLVPKVIE